jgi:hypothetical protein
MGKIKLMKIKNDKIETDKKIKTIISNSKIKIGLKDSDSINILNKKPDSINKESMKTEGSHDPENFFVISSKGNNIANYLMSPGISKDKNVVENWKKDIKKDKFNKSLKLAEDSMVVNDSGFKKEFKVTLGNQEESHSLGKGHSREYRKKVTTDSLKEFEESFIISTKTGEEEISKEIQEMKKELDMLEGSGLFYLNSKSLEIYKIKHPSKKRNFSDQLMSDIKDFTSKVIEDSKNLFLHFIYLERSTFNAFNIF